MHTTPLLVHHPTASAGNLRSTQAGAFVENWLSVIRAEYREFPGLQLTAPQARRLWNLDQATCDRLLAALIDVRFLRRTQTGAYARAD